MNRILSVYDYKRIFDLNFGHQARGVKAAFTLTHKGSGLLPQLQGMGTCLLRIRANARMRMRSASEVMSPVKSIVPKMGVSINARCNIPFSQLRRWAPTSVAGAVQCAGHLSGQFANRDCRLHGVDQDQGDRKGRDQGVEDQRRMHGDAVHVEAPVDHRHRAAPLRPDGAAACAARRRDRRGRRP